MTVDLNKLKIGDKAKVIYVGADVDMICVGDIVTVISNDESGYLNYKIELDGDKNSNYEPYWAGIEPRPDLGCSTDAYIQIEKYEEQEKPAQIKGDNWFNVVRDINHKLFADYDPSTAKTKWDKFYKKEKEILFKLDMIIKPHNIDKIEVDILKLVKKYKLKGK